MTFSEAMTYIQGYQKSGKPVHDLSRIQALLEALGNPQEQLQVVHIAGTNGKGSVTAFCAGAATAAGFRTGTLTSPFIRHYTDRIQIDGRDIPPEALCRFCEQVQACPVSQDCSQFEITFAIALLWFVEQKCDLVVLETGIGGLLALGVGDTIRVSLTDDPVKEVYAAKAILKAVGRAEEGINVVSCPTCGRTRINLIDIAKEVEQRCQSIHGKKMKVAVMGCVVNGPGEAREADLGIAGGDGVGLIFRRGEIIKKVPQEQLVDALMDEIAQYEGE